MKSIFALDKIVDSNGNYNDNVMSASNWISIVGFSLTIFVPMLGGMLIIAFRMGQIQHQLQALAMQVQSLMIVVESLVRKVQKIEVDIVELRVKVEVLWQKHLSQSNSPLALNDNGQRILKSSGIDVLMDQRYNEILNNVRSHKPTNVYQVQELVITTCYGYKDDASWREQLEIAAFQSGCDVGTLLYVGSLNIRDNVIRDLGFNPENPQQVPAWIAS
jgi:hypothetical protein